MSLVLKPEWTRRLRHVLGTRFSDEAIELLANLAWLG